MSNELLAKVALNAMRGEGEEAQLLFEEYCEKQGIEIIGKGINLPSIATSCMEIVAGECEEENINFIAKEFGFIIDDMPEKSPNGDMDALEAEILSAVVSEQ